MDQIANEAQRIIRDVEQERLKSLTERPTGASDEDLAAATRDLEALRAWLQSGPSGPPPVRPESLSYRVVDRWSLTAPLSAELIKLMQKLEGMH